MIAFDPVAMLTRLHRRDVEFVVIGGVAGYLFGSTLPSANLDICFASDVANRQRLITALNDMHAYLRGQSIEVDADALQTDDVQTFKTDHGILHCVRTPLGTAGYDDLRARSERVEIDGVSTDLAGLEDLIRMKQVSARPKDQYLFEALRATLRLRQRR